MTDTDPSDDRNREDQHKTSDDTEPVEQNNAASDREDTQTAQPEQSGSTRKSEQSDTIPVSEPESNEETSVDSDSQNQTDSGQPKQGNGSSDGAKDDSQDEPGSHSEHTGERVDPPSADLEAKLLALEETVEGFDERIDELEASLNDFQRRNEHEHEEIKKYAIEDFARDMLKIKDNLQDAIKLEELQEDTERRFRILDKQFEQRFTSGGIDKIEPSSGEDYDDDLHRMIDKEESDEHEKEEIIRVVDPGYVISDRVIRPAQVVVTE